MDKHALPEEMHGRSLGALHCVGKCTLVDLLGVWTYSHIVSLRRISTPHDLGAAVRDARTAAELTQAQLAERAGVSREWLIGLERGVRPRAELTKILEVLSALDQPIMLGHEQEPGASDTEAEQSRDKAAMTTAEITRRAIERSRQPGSATPSTWNAGAAAASAAAVGSTDITEQIASMAPKTDLASLMPKTDLSSLMRRIDLPALMRPTDLPSLTRKTDFSALMPQPSPALQSLLRELSTASATARDVQHEENEDDHDPAREVDGDEGTDSADREGQLW
ncbi:MAG: helix-turn-helix domain-containing protein [Brachybacterium sp.]|nr:helix-turn-helix domain-containing protein [Brachybacterium sp.]